MAEAFGVAGHVYATAPEAVVTGVAPTHFAYVPTAPTPPTSRMTHRRIRNDYTTQKTMNQVKTVRTTHSSIAHYFQRSFAYIDPAHVFLGRGRKN
jgi:hypothetical protein